MATRQTRLITKNSITSGSTLPIGTNILKGEAVVNLSEGILFYSGNPSSANFTPSNYNSGYFEVGSNLYDLKIRNKIVEYQGETTNLAGKFLSGTSTGFVLAPIASIGGISAFTYTASANTFTIFDADGTPFSANFSTVSGLTVNGDLTVTGNTNLNIISGGSLTITGDTILSSFTGGTGLINGNLTVTGNTSLNGTLNVTGDTVITSFTGNTGLINGDLTVTGNTNVNGNLNVTGDTIITSFTGNTGLINGNLTITGNTDVNGNLNVTGNTIITSFTGGTGLINGNLTITGNTNISGDTTIDGDTTLNGNVYISGFNPNLVVYTNNLGYLTTESGFGYNEGSDLLTVNNLTVNNTGQTANFGVGGVVIGSGGSIGPSGGTAGQGDLIVHGNLMVFGDSISAYTSNLYVEDKNITLNYNPSASTAYNSVNSGFQIQDGNGLLSGDTNVNFDIIRMAYFTGNTGQAPNIDEYSGLTEGYQYRGWITQLNDIVIRSTDVIDDGSIASVKGVRVLAEFDVLDGGTY